MKNIIIIAALLLSVSVSFADECVTKAELDKAIQFYQTGYNAINNPPQFITLECDPCKCPGIDGVYSQSSCLEFLAKKERDKERLKNNADQVLERFRKHGVCPDNLNEVVFASAGNTDTSAVLKPSDVALTIAALYGSTCTLKNHNSRSFRRRTIIQINN